VAHIERVIQEVSAHSVSTDNRGRDLNPFPQVPDLDMDCGTFLIQANRAIKLICELPRFFISLDRADSNFDHLGKRLAAILGESTPLTEFVTSNADGIRYLIDLRNFHEHPKEKSSIAERSFPLLNLAEMLCQPRS
jgi:hypothetical protein